MEDNTMCGIIGYVGPRLAVPVLLEGLKAQEYRGYDSAGIAVLENGAIRLIRTQGKISELEKGGRRDRQRQHWHWPYPLGHAWPAFRYQLSSPSGL